LIIAEGVETMLSAVQLAGGTSAVAGIAACGSLSTLNQLPACSEVVIARDRDKPGKDTDCAGVARALAGGIKKHSPDVRVRIVRTPKQAWNDWNDALQEAPDPQRVWDRAIERAEEVEGPADPLDWKRMFMVSAERIAAMADAKMALPGQIPHAQSLVYCGEGGAGKTTLWTHQAALLRQAGYSVTYVQADIGMSEVKEAQRHADESGYDLLLPNYADGVTMDDIVDTWTLRQRWMPI
jgi:Toprim domain